jgi:hypothetical protein
MKRRTNSPVDIKQAILNPENVFDAPEDVLAEPTLTEAEKVEVLRVWAYDATEAGVTLEEGMPGGENGPPTNSTRHPTMIL